MSFDVGKRIKEYREVKGISVNKLANISGISQSYLRSVELSEKNPSIEKIERICCGLDISLEEFFTNSKGKEMEDELVREIYRLDKEQKEALKIFLKALHK